MLHLSPVWKNKTWTAINGPKVNGVKPVSYAFTMYLLFCAASNNYSTCEWVCVLQMCTISVRGLIDKMGVSVHTLALLLVTIWLVKKGVRDIQKTNRLQIHADAKWKGSGYNWKGKHTYTPVFTYFLKENKVLSLVEIGSTTAESSDFAKSRARTNIKQKTIE